MAFGTTVGASVDRNVYRAKEKVRRHKRDIGLLIAGGLLATGTAVRMVDPFSDGAKDTVGGAVDVGVEVAHQVPTPSIKCIPGTEFCRDGATSGNPVVAEQPSVGDVSTNSGNVGTSGSRVILGAGPVWPSLRNACPDLNTITPETTQAVGSLIRQYALPEIIPVPDGVNTFPISIECPQR